MNDAKGKGPAQKKGKKKGKHAFYKIEGNRVVRQKTCPKCGSGVFMAVHSKRMHCGKCSYTEFR